MKSLLARWLVTTLAILAVSYLLPGVEVEGLGSALAVAAVLGVLNFVVKPVLVLLTLPITIVSLGFFLLVINALVFELAASVVRGVHVASFWSALFASLFVSFVSWLMHLSFEGQSGRRTIVVKQWQDERSDDDVIDV